MLKDARLNSSFASKQDGLSRRSFLKSSLKASALFSLAGAGLAGNPLIGWAGSERHGLSVFGGLKYAPGFAHFDYINPDAPKGGRFVFTAPSWAYNQNPQTFNTLNGFVLRGDAPPRIELLFDTLMVRALDEPDAVYCHLAQSVSLSEDGKRFRFVIRPEARFSDGSPVTADDVAFSYNLLKEKGHPVLKTALRDLDKAEIDGNAAILVFTGQQSRQAPIDASILVPIFSKAYYSQTEFDKSSLKPPLGSGPYKVGQFNPGSFINYNRRPDYWGKDLATARGHSNFDVIRLIFSRERTVLFEAFKKGEITFYEEFSSKSWATQYEFPAIQDGRAFKLEIPDNRASGAQGWFFNLRRKKFADPRTREAIGLAFDFEWSNKNLFYGLYQRTHSFFERTRMKAEGPASGKVLALLAPFRDRLNPAVFDAPYTPPASNATGKDRKLLGRANKLLQEAGWKRSDKGLINKDGELLEIELLANSPLFERIATPWINNLALLGITMTFRLVDPAQYQARVDEFDFDMTGRRFALSPTLSESVRSFWGSHAAHTNGSYNIAGVADPVLDAMIDAALSANTRQEMEAAGQAIDRIWRAGHYWVPNWNKPIHTLGVWQGFGWPKAEGLHDFLPESWWWAEP